MVQSCVVVGCTNRWERKSTISWHQIPKESNSERRKQWLTAINRKNSNPSNQDRVCGIHFLSGCASQDPNDPDFAPSVNMGYNNLVSSTPEVKLGRYTRARGRSSKRLLLEGDENDRHMAASILVDLSSLCNTNMEFDADEESSPPKSKYTPERCKELEDELKVCKETLAQARDEQHCLMEELKCLQDENRCLKADLENNRFGVQFLQNGSSEKKTQFYTGLPNFATFLWIVTFLQTSLPVFSSISCENIVLLTLMKLRINSHNYDLAYRFKISQTTVSDVLNRSLPVIAEKLNFFIHWPEKEDVLRTLPKVFKPKYKKARTIIDCTELFIERPRNLTARALTWSNYKHHNTLKYLVAITPLGAISFISRAYGGRTSDKVLTQRCGFLDLLENGDLVLADRGFLISEEITARNCFLSIPAFTKGQSQLTQQQVETSRQITNVRIHVERAIGRLKTFKIISQQMPLSMVPHCDNILTICSAVFNLQGKLVK